MLLQMPNFLNQSQVVPIVFTDSSNTGNASTSLSDHSILQQAAQHQHQHPQDHQQDNNQEDDNQEVPLCQPIDTHTKEESPTNHSISLVSPSTINSGTTACSDMSHISTSCCNKENANHHHHQITTHNNTKDPNTTTATTSKKNHHHRFLQRHHTWLLLIRHATKCQVLPGKCKVKRCLEMKQICQHIQTCQRGRSCTTRHCVASKRLLSHYMRCPRGGFSCNSRGNSRESLSSSSTFGSLEGSTTTNATTSMSTTCPICDPVKSFIREAKKRDKLGSLLDELECLAISN